MNRTENYKKLTEDIAKLQDDDFENILKWVIVEFNIRTKRKVEEMRRAFNDKY